MPNSSGIILSSHMSGEEGNRISITAIDKAI